MVAKNPASCLKFSSDTAEVEPPRVFNRALNASNSLIANSAVLGVLPESFVEPSGASGSPSWNRPRPHGSRPIKIRGRHPVGQTLVGADR